MELVKRCADAVMESNIIADILNHSFAFGLRNFEGHRTSNNIPALVRQILMRSNGGMEPVLTGPLHVIPDQPDTLHRCGNVSSRSVGQDYDSRQFIYLKLRALINCNADAFAPLGKLAPSPGHGKNTKLEFGNSHLQKVVDLFQRIQHLRDSLKHARCKHHRRIPLLTLTNSIGFDCNSDSSYEGCSRKHRAHPRSKVSLFIRRKFSRYQLHDRPTDGNQSNNYKPKTDIGKEPLFHMIPLIFGVIVAWRNFHHRDCSKCQRWIFHGHR